MIDGNEEPEPQPVTESYLCQNEQRIDFRMEVTWIPREDFGDNVRVKVVYPDGSTQDSGEIRATGLLQEALAGSPLLAKPYIAYHSPNRTSLLLFNRNENQLRLATEYVLTLGQGGLQLEVNRLAGIDGFLKGLVSATCAGVAP
jgi:hypothetical protein